MTDKLSLYNLALAHLRERRVAALSEQREPKRVLDDLYAQEVAYCLERKLWNFGYRAEQIDASTTLTPTFGFLFAFKIPDDWIRTRRLSATPTFDPPLFQVMEEAGYWYANLTPIFVQFNSSDGGYGMNLGKWPASFTDYVSKRLARVAAGRIAGKEELLAGPQGLIKEEERAYKIAAANCAMNEAVGFQPQGSWVRSRRGFTSQIPGPGGDSPSGSSLIP